MIALVVSLGTTPEPIKKAIEEAKEEGEMRLYLAYGRSFPGQKPDPLEMANVIKKFAVERGILVYPYELPDPESLDLCLRDFFKIIKDVQESLPEKIIVDFTGGTKPMSAALVHSALTHLAENLSFEYVGGKERDEHGRVIGEKMDRKSFSTRVEELIRRALDLAQQHSYSQSLAICKMLPQIGRPKFFSKAVRSLWLWDNFFYEEALEEIKEMKGVAEVWIDDPELGSLANTILRLREGAEVKSAHRLFQRLEQNQESPRRDESAIFLVADFLENAQRRLQERRFTDAVLRCYRSVEIATQASLVSLGINPWRPEWQSLEAEKLKEYLLATGRRNHPEKITLHEGFTLLGILQEPFEEEIRKDLEELSYLRNYSHLEHGYEKVGEKAAREAPKKAERLCEAILSKEGFKVNLLEETRQKIAHRI